MKHYREVLENAWVRETSIDKFKEMQCVIFDCDGTLVNINNSYNACIKFVVGFILEKILGGKQWYSLVTDEVIAQFRMSGGFNSDIDTSFASILSAVGARTDNVEAARQFVLNAAKQADERGVPAVEKYLNKFDPFLVKKVGNDLKHPGMPGASLLSTVFDEFFYGKEIFEKMYEIKTQFNNASGFIDKDEVLITTEQAERISIMFNGKMAIVSGRSKIATEYTLRPLLRYFDMQASVFIEDEEKQAIKNNLDIKVNKPHAYALLKSMKALTVNNALCTGDSVEDILMARNASEGNNVNTIFCGVFGALPYKQLQFNVFMEKNVDAIIENVNTLPRLIERLKS